MEYLRRRILRLERRHIAALQALYREARAAMEARLWQVYRRYTPGASWTSGDAWFARRTQEIIAALDAESARLESILRGRLDGDFSRVYRAAYYGTAWLLSRVLGADFPIILARLPTDVITAASDFPYEGLSWAQRMMDNRAEFIRRLRREIILSQVMGEGLQKANGRLAGTLDRWQNSSELIARTEIHRAKNQGAMTLMAGLAGATLAAFLQGNRELLRGFRWVAIVDDRTCAVCLGLNTQVFQFGAKTPPPQHPRCRCHVIPVIRDFTELGLPLGAALGAILGYHDWAERNNVDAVKDGGVL